MKTVLLYRVVSEKVGVSDSFSVLRSPSIDEPRHVLGNGMTLVGVQQMPPPRARSSGARRWPMGERGVPCA